jgi:hypothetical protein
MNKKTPIFVAAAFLFVASVGFSTHASPPADGECPQGWTMVRVNKANDRDRAEEEDRNNDRWVCYQPNGDLYDDNRLHEED